MRVRSKSLSWIRCPVQPLLVTPGVILPPPSFCGKQSTSKSSFSTAPNKGKCCKEPGCMVMAAFGPADAGEALYCRWHKAAGMVDKVRRPYSSSPPRKGTRCKHEGCMVISAFGPADAGGALYCSKHRRPYSSSAPIMVTRCEHEGCKKQAQFGWVDDGKAISCSVHKEAEMENVRRRKCEHPDCPSV